MRLFKCQHCAQVLYFENTSCERCGSRLGFLSDLGTLSALDADEDGWRALAAPQGRRRFCANAEFDTCNWLVTADHAAAFCAACRHNGTVPHLADPANRLAWTKIEAAKHRLIYTLMRLGLPLTTRADDPEHGLVFDFLADPAGESGPRVMTGHDSGRITISLAEADDAERERRRTAMGEPYRTLVGHFRHEIGHHYWDVLVREGDHLDACRSVFGDDRQDYGAALNRHYVEGAPAGWQSDFVSTYATTHPWEDFAETFAHYLHIVDTLEMARAFDLRVSPRVDTTGILDAEVDFDPYRAADFAPLIDAWLPLTFALNNLNRTMGLPDLYPFILAPAVIAKLGFVHRLVRNAAGAPSRG